MDYVGFRAVVIRDGKIALIERWNKGRHYFVLPGGHLEKGESARDCVIREIREELNIVIEPKAQIYDLIDFQKQGIFFADWVSGTVSKTDAEEYRDDRIGGDYEPVLVEINELKSINLVPETLKNQLLIDLQNGDLATRPKIAIKSKYKGR